MMTRDERERVLASLSATGRAAFVGTCASKVMPFIRRCGEAGTLQVGEEACKVLWRAASGQVDEGALRSLLDAVKAAPEAELDDSALLESNAGAALGVLHYALSSIAGPGAAKAAISAARRTIEMYSVLDYVASPTWPHPRVVNPQAPPAQGPLELAESEDQAQLLTALTKEDVSHASIRARASAATGVTDAAVGRLVEKWTAWLETRGSSKD